MSPWGKAPSICWEWVVPVVFVEKKALGWGVSLSMVPETVAGWGPASSTYAHVAKDAVEPRGCESRGSWVVADASVAVVGLAWFWYSVQN